MIEYPFPIIEPNMLFQTQHKHQQQNSFMKEFWIYLAWKNTHKEKYAQPRYSWI